MTDIGVSTFQRQQSQPATPPPAATRTSSAPLRPKRKRPSRAVLIGILVLAAIGGGIAWYVLSRPKLPPGFAGGNGRLEANQVFISTKYPGRIKEVLFNEGDTVEAGQVVARMDTSALEAQLREAEAQIRASQDSRNVALAQVQVKQADYDYARKQYERSKGLVTKGAVSEQEAEVDNASMLAGRAQLVGAKAQAVQTLSTIDAARATADRLRAEIADAVLTSAIRARVETRLAEPGEVLAAGGRVFSTNDLSDVYMYVYLPESVTGKVPLGSEARIVLDAAPQYPIRAYVSYVSPMAQFTPKTVETAEERHNLTFRVKLQIPKDRLREYEPLVKTGLPGMGYVRYTGAPWPADLQPKANVPTNLWKPTGASGGGR
jgi:HlyD family secretion protein